MTSWYTSPGIRRYGFPLVLLLLAALGLGCYFESNDDILMVFMLRGVGLEHPVTDLTLYFHGLAAALAHLYQVLPAWPWYGLLLYALLAVALLLLSSVLDQLMAERFSPAQRVSLLGIFFVAAFLEPIIRLNFTRISILLAGAATLYSLQRLRHSSRLEAWWILGALLLLAAWCIRPSGAYMGVAMVAPVAWWLAPRRRGAVLLATYAALLLGASGARILFQQPSARGYQQLDVYMANHQDYALYAMHPRTTRDSLALESLSTWWGLSDTTLLNVRAFRRMATVSARHTLHDVLPGKALAQGQRMAGDYFLHAFVSLLLLWAMQRQPNARSMRWAAYYSLYVAALLLFTSIVLYLPARVASSMVSLYLAGLLGYALPRLAPGPLGQLPGWRALSAVFLVLFGGYLAKNFRRAYRHHRERVACEQYLARIGAYVGARPLVMVSPALVSLSPLRNYDLSRGPSFVLNGWTSQDASQKGVLHTLTGTTDFRLAMQRLATRDDVVWLLPQGFGRFFTRYLDATSPAAPIFCPTGPPLPRVDVFMPPTEFNRVCGQTPAYAPRQAATRARP